MLVRNQSSDVGYGRRLSGVFESLVRRKQVDSENVARENHHQLAKKLSALDLVAIGEFMGLLMFLLSLICFFWGGLSWDHVQWLFKFFCSSFFLFLGHYGLPGFVISLPCFAIVLCHWELSCLCCPRCCKGNPMSFLMEA